MTPCEPLQFGHILVKEQLTPACHHQTNEFTLTRPRDFISPVSKEGVTESKETCSASSTSRDKALDQNGEVYSETDWVDKKVG